MVYFVRVFKRAHRASRSAMMAMQRMPTIAVTTVCWLAVAMVSCGWIFKREPMGSRPATMVRITAIIIAATTTVSRLDVVMGTCAMALGVPKSVRTDMRSVMMGIPPLMTSVIPNIVL